MSSGHDRFAHTFPLADPPDYEPRESDSISARAAAVGADPIEFLYDLLLEDEGKTFVYRAEVASTSVAAAAVRRLIDGFWKGSADQFLTGLVDEKVLSAADLRRLAKKVGGRK